MSDILTKNMEALKDKYPVFYDYFKNFEPDRDGDGINPETCDVDGKKILSVHCGDRVYQMDSLYDSDTLLNIWYENVKKNITLDSKYIMFGFGNGMYARMFLENADMENIFIAYEPSEKIFFETLNNFDVSDIIKNEKFVLLMPTVMNSRTFLGAMSSILKFTDVTTACVALHTNYDKLFEKERRDFYTDMDKAFELAQLSNAFLAQRGKLVNQNMKGNLKYFAISKKLTDLQNKLPNVPAIIVSAGPSLNNNIRNLAAAKGKAVIIAVDSAIKTMKKYKIDPDIFVAVDPRKDERFLGDDKCAGIPFMTNIRVNAGIVRTHEGPQFFENSQDYFVQKFFEKENMELPALESGGSVATTAFSLARYMGCEPIILVGQDLAYTGDKTHAAESVDAFRTVEELDGNIIDTDVFGNPIKTSADMLRYKEWFERYALENQDLTLYDATEGGALIKGSIVITLKEVIEKECTKPCEVKPVFENAEPLFNEIQKEHFTEEMLKMPSNLKEDKEKVRKLLLNYSKLKEMINLNKYNSSGFASLSRKSNDLLSEVEEDPVMDFVMNGCYDRTNDISYNINHMEEDEKEELKSVIDLSIRYAEVLRDAIKENEDDITEMVERLKTV